MQYQINEGSFSVPDGMQDNSINVLLAGHSGLGFSVVVTRSRLEPGETFEQLVNRQLQLLGQQFSMAEFTDRSEHKDSASGQLRAIEYAVQFKQDGVMVYQRQVGYLLGNTGNVVVMTAAAQAPLSDAQLTQWRAIRASFKPA
ncbi:DcrB-related protein [Acidovorax sp. LjRoot117]|uniref:DcrB-related protein n=1 Tax=Acidovorax sp. LjRoot117 TaxID=3342255 RepID=UPI003ECF7A6D